jgi:hypothetical protein
VTSAPPPFVAVTKLTQAPGGTQDELHPRMAVLGTVPGDVIESSGPAPTPRPRLRTPRRTPLVTARLIRTDPVIEVLPRAA